MIPNEMVPEALHSSFLVLQGPFLSAGWSGYDEAREQDEIRRVGQCCKKCNGRIMEKIHAAWDCSACFCIN
jgi:hypothetical protein